MGTLCLEMQRAWKHPILVMKTNINRIKVLCFPSNTFHEKQKEYLSPVDLKKQRNCRGSTWYFSSRQSIIQSDMTLRQRSVFLLLVRSFERSEHPLRALIIMHSAAQEQNLWHPRVTEQAKWDDELERCSLRDSVTPRIQLSRSIRKGQLPRWLRSTCGKQRWGDG